MHDDELRSIWARHDLKLERCLRLNEQRLRTEALRGARRSLSYHVSWRVLELALAAAALGGLGGFIAARLAEPRFVASGVALHVFVAGVLGFLVYELTLIARMDYRGPVTGLQRAVERIERVEYRAFKWALFGGVLLWAFVPIVIVEALFEVDLFEQLAPAWIFGNVAFGLVVLVLGQAWSRAYVEGHNARPWAKRFIEHLSGRSLRRANAFLEELDAFER